MNYHYKTMILATIICTLVANIATLVEQITMQDNLKTLDISKYVERFDKIRQSFLEPDVVNYETDCCSDILARKYIAQYAISPIIIDNTAAHSLLIGNYCNTELDINMHKKKEITLVEDYGNGIMLFRRDIK